jgi:hypothetical protein
MELLKLNMHLSLLLPYYLLDTTLKITISKVRAFVLGEMSII